MKNLVFTIGFIISMFFSNVLFSQTQRTPAALGRAEYIEVEKNVKLHVSDLGEGDPIVLIQDRKSTRLNSSHVKISYAVFCLKKKNKYYEIHAVPLSSRTVYPP